MSTENTNGRVAVITGASSGIGEAAARALVADGHRVALMARRLDRVEALADELGEAAIAIQADVTDGAGDLINLSSVAGRTARPGNAVYAATKWG